MGEPDSVTLDGVQIFVGRPVRETPAWVGQREVLIQVLAAWTQVEKADLPLNPRLLGPGRQRGMVGTLSGTAKAGPRPRASLPDRSIAIAARTRTTPGIGPERRPS